MANELNISKGTTGLTVTAKLYLGAAAVGSAISLTEIGTDGFYTGSVGTLAAGSYSVQFFAAGSVIGSGSLSWNGTAEVTPLKLETDISEISGGGGGSGGPVTLDGITSNGIAAIQGALATRTINVQSPLVITSTGTPTVTIVAGDDYYSADGRAISFASLAGSWPNWTGATYSAEFGTLTVSAFCTVSTGSTRSIYFELSAAQTTLLKAFDSGDGIFFDLVVTLSNGHRTTVINQGILIVLDNV